MTSLILPSRFNQQPQQPAPLDRGNSLTRGAQAIVNGAMDSNAASGALMRVGGTGFARTAKRGGLAMAFRKNCYRASAVQPAIGTQTFVEFWYGYPTSDNGAKGGATEPSFVTGSSNNSTGIATMIGAARATAATPEIAPHWGAVSTWPAFNSSGEALTAGELTLLVVVRRQSGMEFWRNGVLVRTVTQAPTSYAASSFIVGAFVEDVAYWSTSSDTLLAGRIAADWTSAQVQAFSANPWQLFAAPQRNLWTAVVAGGATNRPVNPGAAAITLTGFAPIVARTASQSVTPAAAALVLTGYAPTVTQSSAATITPNPATLVLTGFAPTVARTASLTLTPAPAQLALTGFAPTVTQTGQPQAPPPSSGGGGGPVREVRAFAERLNQPEKRSRSEKRKRRRELETEALELLPDLPEAEAFAPIVAQLVFEQEARALANWTPVKAMQPLAFNAEQALREQIAAWLQQIEHQKLIDDEHDLELLLLG